MQRCGCCDSDEWWWLGSPSAAAGLKRLSSGFSFSVTVSRELSESLSGACERT